MIGDHESQVRGEIVNAIPGKKKKVYKLVLTGGKFFAKFIVV